MDFLRFLEGLRTPFFDTVLGGMTYLGDEIVATVLILVILWCFSKRAGYFLFYGIIFSTSLNQGLKHAFRIPRPWVLDPDFTIVENARAAATGYSFPSGHSACAVNLYGGLCFYLKKWWQRLILIALACVVIFSRLYLGVHTPLDVGVSAAVGVVILFALYYAYQAAMKSGRALAVLNAVLVLFTLSLVLFVELLPVPADIDPENLAGAHKNVWTMFGMSLGMVCAQWLDNKYIRFDVKAVWWVQICKTVVGLVIVLLVQKLTSSPLLAICGGHAFAHAIRYFLVVLTGAALYPITFRFWARLGKPRVKAAAQG